MDTRFDMSVLKKNLAANFAGSVWITLMNLAFIPLYIKFMGVEAYGLIGIFTTIQGVSGILDMGLSATMTREMARLSAVAEKAQEMRNLLRSVEVIYWGVAFLIALVIITISPFIAHHWIKAGQISPEKVEHALMLMGFAMALQWPGALYSGSLIGLQSQILLNVVNIVMNTLRGVGAILVLWLISPTIEVFFCWQILINGTNTFVLALFIWRNLPQGDAVASFQKQLLAGVWKFAAGMTAISLVATILTQMDKVILSKMLTLEVFGYYTLAGVVATSLYRIIGPVFSAVYPRFIQLVTLGDEDGLVKLYHKSCQFLSVLILPVTAVIAFFSYEIMYLWTRNPITAERSYLLVSLLIVGTALNGLMNVPYALQLANGWTKLSLVTNLIAIALLVPMVIFMTSRYGAVGGASVWILLNGSYVLISGHFMHRRLLQQEKWHWYRQDILFPLAASLVVAGLGRVLMPNGMSEIILILFLVVVSVLTLFVTAIATPTIRERLFSDH